jgi:RimJ/RimL family protein N-acetyltransferase
VIDILTRFKTVTFPFKYQGTQGHAPSQANSDGEQWLVADRTNIDLFFGADRSRHRPFIRFWKAGCLGLFMVRDGNWIFCGWSGMPGSRFPSYLPQNILKRGGYWTFGVHTREEFRGKGYYKQGMLRLAHLIQQRDPEGTVYSDTNPSNAAVRHALPSIGFKPCGVIITYKLWVPRVGHWALWGKWLRNEPHPSGITLPTLSNPTGESPLKHKEP